MLEVRARRTGIAKTALLVSLMAIFISNSAISQCSCSLIVGSGAGTNVTNLSQVPAAQTVAGGCIRIKGTFYVDAGLTWDLDHNTRVFLDPGAGITVNPGCTFKADSGCVFTKCDPFASNWGQITVLSGASVYMDSCYLHHASTAVRIQPNATFFLTYNTIDSFGIGINIFGTQNLVNHEVKNNRIVNGNVAGIRISAGNKIRINYNWIFDADRSMVGVDMTQGCRAVTIKDCILSNLSTGVQAKSTVDDIEIRGIIFNGDVGVSAHNCWLDFGIYRSIIRATYEGVWFKEHQTSLNGNPAQYGALMVDGSTVSSVHASAIKADKTYGSGHLKVTNNKIRPAYDPPSFGYYGIEITDVSNAQVFVQSNTVAHLSYISNPASAPGGIYLYLCKRQNLVSDNKVEAGPYGKLNFGITVAESPNLQVVNNTVSGGNPGIDLAAVSMENNHENMLLCCTTVDSASKGLNLAGAIENCDISGTVFNAHTDALYYDMVATFSGITQFHRGNDWSTANTNWDAYYNGNEFFTALTQYRVDPAYLANTTKISVNGGGNSNDWFKVISHTEDACGTAAYCGHTPYEPGFSENGGETLTGNDYWAAGTLADEDYAAIHWGAQRHLYEKLIKSPALLNESAAIAGFFTAAATGNIGMFYALEDGLARLYEPSASIAVDYYAAREAFRAQNAELDALDEAIAGATAWELPDLLAERDALVQDIETASATLAVYDADIEAALPAKLDALKAINDAIEPVAGYEVYQKAVNAHYLNARIAGDWSFDANEQSDIDAIAGLCPLYAGRAVYEARALQEHYRVPVWNNCPVVGERSEQAGQVTAKGFSIRPNPAIDQVQVYVLPSLGTDYWVTLRDVLGGVIEEQFVPEGSEHVAIPLRKCRSGIYIVQISNTTGRPVSQQKLSIIR